MTGSRVCSRSRDGRVGVAGSRGRRVGVAGSRSGRVGGNERTNRSIHKKKRSIFENKIQDLGHANKIHCFSGPPA